MRLNRVPTTSLKHIIHLGLYDMNPFRYLIRHIGPSLFICLLAAAGCASAAATKNVWQSTASLHTPRTGAGVVEAKDVIYAIGGVDGHAFLTSSEFSAIQKDGGLAPWQAGSDLNEARGFFGAAAHGGFIYVVGGGNGPSGHHLLRSVERAAIQADGSLGPWHREPQQLNFPRRCAKVVAVGDYLYAIGGFGGTLFDSVERAHFDADGGLGPWQLLTGKLTMPRYIHAEAMVNGRLYVLGGHARQGGLGEAAVEYAPLHDGGLGPWQASVPLQHGRYGLAAVSHGDYLYALGGMNGAGFSAAVEKNHVDADGALGVWHEAAPLPAPLADFGAVVYRDRLYIVGGTSPQGYFDNVFMARFGADGELLATGERRPAPAPVNRVELPNGGIVAQALDGGTYIYLEVDTGEGREWLAAAHADIAVGDHVRYSDGIWMKDFFSKYLQRRFKAIRFVGNLEKVKAK
jgi:hypothetical protein